MLLFTNAVYPFPLSKETLRLQLGKGDDTLPRAGKAMERIASGHAIELTKEVITTDNGMQLVVTTNDEKRLVVAIVEAMKIIEKDREDQKRSQGKRQEEIIKAADILLNTEEVPKIISAVARKYLEERKIYLQLRKQSKLMADSAVFEQARQVLFARLSSEPDKQKRYFYNKWDSPGNFLATNNDENLFKYELLSQLAESANRDATMSVEFSFMARIDGPSLEILLNKGTRFNPIWAGIIQRYIANPRGLPEEKGRINSQKLDDIIKAADNIKVTGKSSDEEFRRPLRIYLTLIKEAKNKNFEITGYISLRKILVMRKILGKFPSELAKLIRVPVDLQDIKLEEGVVGKAGISTGVGIEVDLSKYGLDEDGLDHLVWHEGVHKVAQSSKRNGKPILPVSIWKKIAKIAGFKYVLINNELFYIDNLPDDYKVFRDIGYGDWIYEEKDGTLSCYLGAVQYDKQINNPRYALNGIELKICNDDDYWKTTPKEAVAEAGAEYIKDSVKALNGRLKPVVAILKNTLFVVEFPNGVYRRYEFAEDNQKFARLIPNYVPDIIPGVLVSPPQSEMPAADYLYVRRSL